MPQKLAQSVNSFPLLAAPLFILMGNIMNSAGITERIFTFATACVGWLRGGLCHANILASVIFAGMSGSAVADAGGVGTLEIKAMRDEGYDPETAAAITAASATIGPIIPPSLPMVIYGVSADVSIGGLFLAGVVPGLLMAVALMLMVAHRRAPRNLPRHPFPGVARPLASRYSARILGADDAGDPVRRHDERHLHADRSRRRRDRLCADPRPLRLSRLRPAHLPRLIVDTVGDHRRGAGAGDDRGGARLVPVARRASRRRSAPSDRSSIGDPLLFLLVVNLLLLFVGCFMEALAAMLILIPILTPVAAQLGIDPLQFGLIFVLNLMIGTITPPVGVVLFVTAKSRHPVRRDGARDRALAHAAARRAGRDHAVAAADHLASRRRDGEVATCARTSSRAS